jgi:hypothetical protein
MKEQGRGSEGTDHRNNLYNLKYIFTEYFFLENAKTRYTLEVSYG